MAKTWKPRGANFVAKHSWKSNKCAAHRDKKRELKRGKVKHKHKET